MLHDLLVSTHYRRCHLVPPCWHWLPPSAHCGTLACPAALLPCCPAASWRQSMFSFCFLSASGLDGIHSLSCSSLLQTPVPASAVPFLWTCLTVPTHPPARRRGGGTSARKRQREDASFWRSGAIGPSLFFFSLLILSSQVAICRSIWEFGKTTNPRKALLVRPASALKVLKV